MTPESGTGSLSISDIAVANREVGVEDLLSHKLILH